jgi:hypothetical protein
MTSSSVSLPSASKRRQEGIRDHVLRLVEIKDFEKATNIVKFISSEVVKNNLREMIAFAASQETPEERSERNVEEFFVAVAAKDWDRAQEVLRYVTGEMQEILRAQLEARR